MRVTIAEAEEQLEDLVRRAEAGETVLITRDGKPVVQLMSEVEHRRRVLDEIRASARGKATPGPDAARSQDFLYGEDGLPK